MELARSENGFGAVLHVGKSHVGVLSVRDAQLVPRSRENTKKSAFG